MQTQANSSGATGSKTCTALLMVCVVGCGVSKDYRSAGKIHVYNKRDTPLEIRVSSGGRVRIMPNDEVCQSECVVRGQNGTVASLRADPGDGLFLGWSAPCDESRGCSVRFGDIRTISAHFAADSHVINMVNQLSASECIGVTEIAPDPTGGAVLLTWFRGIASESGYRSAGSSDMLITSITDDRTVRWSVQISSSDTDVARMTPMVDGDIFIVTSIGDNGSVGEVRFRSRGTVMAAIARETGAVLWTRKVSGYPKTSIAGPAGGAVAAFFELPRRSRIARVDSSGDAIWTTYFESSNSVSVDQLAIAGNKLVVLGTVLGVAKFHQSSTERRRQYLSYLDLETGQFVSTRWLADSIVYHDVSALDEATILAGRLSGEATVDNKTLNSVGHEDLLIHAMDASGAAIWVRTMGGLGHDLPIQVRTSADGIFVAGITTDTVRLPLKWIGKEGRKSWFVVKLQGDGRPVWALDREMSDVPGKPIWVMPSGESLFIAGALGIKTDLGGILVPQRSGHCGSVFVAEFSGLNGA